MVRFFTKLCLDLLCLKPSWLILYSLSIKILAKMPTRLGGQWSESRLLLVLLLLLRHLRLRLSHKSTTLYELSTVASELRLHLLSKLRIVPLHGLALLMQSNLLRSLLQCRLVTELTLEGRLLRRLLPHCLQLLALLRVQRRKTHTGHAIVRVRHLVLDLERLLYLLIRIRVLHKVQIFCRHAAGPILLLN